MKFQVSQQLMQQILEYIGVSNTTLPVSKVLPLVDTIRNLKTPDMGPEEPLVVSSELLQEILDYISSSTSNLRVATVVLLVDAIRALKPMEAQNEEAPVQAAQG